MDNLYYSHEDDELRQYLLDEARKEAKDSNPLRGYCERVYIQRSGCKYRKNHKKAGKRRKYKYTEVELLRFLPSGRCVQFRDTDTPGIDALAEEIFKDKYIDPDKNVVEVFIEYFRKL